MFEEAIKQMKRLQNPRIVDGNDENDMENMEDIEHQGEDVSRCPKLKLPTYLPTYAKKKVNTSYLPKLNTYSYR